MEVGVLALQGGFKEHRKMLRECGAASREIRKTEHLENINGLIIPGGESTTIGKLMVEYDLLEPIKKMGEKGMPIFGTCAGMVLLARYIYDNDQPRLDLMDTKVVRNGFGRQKDSFEADLEISALGFAPFRAVFIRAPYIRDLEPNVGIMAVYNERIVLARQGNILAGAFHPELAEDTRLHQYFLEIVRSSGF